MAFCLAGGAVGNLPLILVAVAGCMLYVGGCYLGDAVDVEFDQENKPTRPIPSGVISKAAVVGIGWAWMIGGLVCFSFAGDEVDIALIIGAVPLAFFILMYAWSHKSTPFLGLPLIGACRMWLVFSAYAAFAYGAQYLEDFTPKEEINMNPILIIAGSVGIYTICFASVARSESNSKKVSLPNLLKLIMLLLPCSVFAMVEPVQETLVYFAVTYIVYTTWLSIAFRQIHQNKGAYVSKCLAGFALLDMVLLSSTGLMNIILCLVLFGLALILQKIAPAT